MTKIEEEKNIVLSDEEILEISHTSVWIVY